MGLKDREIFFPKEGVFSPSHIERSKGEKVCALDLDDVLVDSITGWVAFADLQMASLFSKEELECPELYWVNFPYDNLYDLKKGVPYYYYRLLKEMYRQSDIKRHLPAMEGAKELVGYLNAAGYKVVIMTKRSDRSANITYMWLLENLPSVDEIIYNKNKHVEILMRYPSLEFMVEDNRDVANIVSRWGYDVFLLDNQYNQGELDQNVIRVNCLKDVVGRLKGA